jgi:hypothetical protein
MFGRSAIAETVHKYERERIFMSTQKFFTLSAALIILMVAATTTLAETLVSEPRDAAPAFLYIMSMKGGTTSNYWDGIQTRDLETDTAYRLFCSDLYTYTSSAFSYGGQTYTTATLADSSFHTDLQKAQLQSLFDHVYTKAFNDDYSTSDALLASLFQFAIWEIMNETSDYLSLREGDLRFTNAGYLAANSSTYYQSNTVLEQALSTLDSWFYAILHDAWDEINYEEEHVNLTVYVAAGGTHVSQTFIGVDPYAQHYQNSVSTTPEPTTLVLVGLGLAGAGIAAARKRRMKKKTPDSV